MYRTTFEKMKGGKNMLYFYCCDVMVRGEIIARMDGYDCLNKRIETIDEFNRAKELLKQDIFKVLSKQKDGLCINEMELLFLALNPL